mmetsp:Transcript_25032/g.62577  ORF Transcript_25032/g.62577 Transcript_25032/m.62577 type:complete len:273 (-) Transcript_25032:497-1315(-)
MHNDCSADVVHLQTSDDDGAWRVDVKVERASDPGEVGLHTLDALEADGLDEDRGRGHVRGGALPRAQHRQQRLQARPHHQLVHLELVPDGEVLQRHAVRVKPDVLHCHRLARDVRQHTGDQASHGDPRRVVDGVVEALARRLAHLDGGSEEAEGALNVELQRGDRGRSELGQVVGGGGWGPGLGLGPGDTAAAGHLGRLDGDQRVCGCLSRRLTVATYFASRPLNLPRRRGLWRRKVRDGRARGAPSTLTGSGPVAVPARRRLRTEQGPSPM